MYPANPGTKILRDIKELLQNQQTSGEPMTKDVDFPRVRRDKVYRITSSFDYGVITSSTSAEVDGSIVPTLAQFANESSFVTVFDTYRMPYLKVSFQPLTGVTTANLSLNSAPIYTALDYDDAATTAISQLLQYDTLKLAPGGAYFERVLCPRAAIAMFSTVFTSYGQATPQQWVDCQSPNVGFYGVKYGLPVTNEVSSWRVTVTALLEFKNTR